MCVSHANEYLSPLIFTGQATEAARSIRYTSFPESWSIIRTPVLPNDQPPFRDTGPMLFLGENVTNYLHQSVTDSANETSSQLVENKVTDILVIMGLDPQRFSPL